MNRRHFLQIYQQPTAHNSNKEHELYSVQQAARLLRVSPSTIWRWIEAGKLPAFRVGEKSIRIKAEDLEAVVRPARDNREEVREMAKEQAQHVQPATEEEIARRKALVKKILALREKLSIAPATTADLIHQVREQERKSYGGGN